MVTVTGMDNALMDILVTIDDTVLEKIGLEKGITHFPPDTIMDQARKLPIDSVSPGGSGANTISLLAQLGVDSAFIGKVGNDENGDIFEKGLEDSGVTSKLVRADGNSGVAICLITPDGQRTFADNLGVANTLTIDELPASLGEIFYVTNYYLTDPATQPAVLEACKQMKQQGGKVVLDFSDPFVVKMNLERLQELVREHVDIVFANEPEAVEFTGLEPEEACRAIAGMCDLAVVKLGKDGSLIGKAGEITRVATPVVAVVDTTGAGDSYAAGFLYGYVNDWSLEKSGELGSLLASKIIQQMGARLERLPDDVIRVVK